ncbi:MAG: LysR family transcriptional regulator [Dehalococcoidia bacterium]|nr:LysR family transcriptional regulator [Dehalococcoidia bacterium]
MNTAWLLTFRRVVEARSFTKASDDLFISQPAVSQQVRHLEQFFGAKLIQQAGRELQLTDAGAYVYELAGRVEQEIRSTRERLDALVNGSQRQVTIASFPAPLLHFVPPALRVFWTEHPEIAVKTIVRHHAEITEAVKIGDADLGIQTRHLDSSLEAVPCRNERLICVSSPSHPLARRPTIQPEDLVHERVATFATGIFRNDIDSWFAERGLNLQNLMEVTTLEEIRVAARENLAIGIIHLYGVHQDIAEGTLIHLNLRDFSLARPFYVIHRKDITEPASWVLRALIDVASESLEE